MRTARALHKMHAGRLLRHARPSVPPIPSEQLGGPTKSVTADECERRIRGCADYRAVRASARAHARLRPARSHEWDEIRSNSHAFPIRVYAMLESPVRLAREIFIQTCAIAHRRCVMAV